jgi:phosphotransferase system  glucose/maltose/N-acetylglucosamine-specific IIC component
MINLLIDLAIVGILFGLLYLIYLIPPIRRWVRYFAYRHWEILITILCAIFASAVMIYVILPNKSMINSIAAALLRLAA